MKDLIGKRIESVHATKEGDLLVFVTDAGPVAYMTTGDCCSKSWVEHLRGVDALVGQTPSELLISERVWSGSDQPMPVIDHEDKRDEQVLVYQLGVRTERGEFWLEFRNGSNGYYGGDLELDHHYKPADLPPAVTEDF